jgi:E3 ubiquitin-protein ligase HUWE1
VDALLSLVAALVSSTSGCSALADAGLISALLPLISDAHPEHVGLVSSAVRILEAYMDFSQPACTLFRDLDGLGYLIARLAHEVGVLGAPAAPEGGAGRAAGSSGGAGGAAGAEITAAAAADTAPVPTAAAAGASGGVPESGTSGVKQVGACV